MPNDPPRNRYELHYAKVEALLQQPLTELRPEAVIRLQAPGFMDLVVEVLLPCQETGATVLSLCHYFELNGDLCQDPEMTVRLFAPGSTEGLTLTPSTNPKLGRAEALTFQQAVPPIYQEVYPQPGRFHPKLRSQLNSFLGQWLSNLEAQGHQPIPSEG